MTSGANTRAFTWRDPWPLSHGAYPDPPWIMRGSRVTAWIDIPTSVAVRALSPNLRPSSLGHLRARLRFYDVEFEGRERSGVSGPRSGVFREAVIGVPAVANQIVGEVSAFMWTDSDTYMCWGREVFGWPIARGAIDANNVRTLSDISPRTRFASVESEAGSAVLHISRSLHEQEEEEEDRVAAAWLTPRTIYRRGGMEEEREVLVVRPTVLAPGVRLAGEGHVDLSFIAGHILHDLSGHLVATIDAEKDFVISVGDNVDVVDVSGLEATDTVAAFPAD